jgi:hypothetical protein
MQTVSNHRELATVLRDGIIKCEQSFHACVANEDVDKFVLFL